MDDAATARAMLTESGQLVTLTRRVVGAYDPATAGVAMTETNATAFGAVFPLSSIRYASHKQADSLIVQGDRQLILEAVTPPPRVDDRVTLADGAICTIVTADPLAPAGVPILYDCTIRATE